jgi:DNA-binding CsgD family transcriptional regulator
MNGGSKKSGRERSYCKRDSLHPTLFVFFDKKSGTRRFEIKADTDGHLPVSQTITLLAMHCVARKQTPRDFSVMVAVGEDLVDGLAGRTSELIESCAVLSGPRPLSRRQNQVLGGITENLTNKEIAMELNVSERTVKFHVSALLEKFDVRRRGDLVVQADGFAFRKVHKRDAKVVGFGKEEDGVGASSRVRPGVSTPLLMPMEQRSAR